MKKAKGIIRSIQAFMDSARGKTVLNYLLKPILKARQNALREK